MLPGFRFLFAAIMLSISTLVFGLGAAALLRASHERFASLPVLPPAPALPPTTTADASLHDAAPPMLALLRTDAVDAQEERDAAPAQHSAPALTVEHAAPDPVPPEAAPQANAEIVPPTPAVAAVEPDTSSPAADSAVGLSSAPIPAAPPAPVKDANAGSIPDTKIESTPTVVDEAVAASAAPEQVQAAAETMSAPTVTAPQPVATPTTPAAATQAPPSELDSEKDAGRIATATSDDLTRQEPVKDEPTPHRVDEIADAEPQPMPIAPADAPITTAMLAPAEPAPSAIPDPAIVITGPIPLPRSRTWALAQGHAAQRAARARKLAAVRAKRPIARQARPVAQAPAPAPNPFFPFGQ